MFWKLLNWFQKIDWIHIGLYFCMFLQFIKIISALQCNIKSKILIHQLSCWSFHFLSFSSLSRWVSFFFFIFFNNSWSNLGLQMMSWWFLCFPDVPVSFRLLIHIFHGTHHALSVFWPLYARMSCCMRPFTASFFLSQFTVKLLEEFDTVLAFRRISHSWANLAWNTKPCSPNPKISIKSKKSTYSDILKRIETHFLGNNTKNILQYWSLHILPEVTVMCKYPSRFLHNKGK